MDWNSSIFGTYKHWNCIKQGGFRSRYRARYPSRESASALAASNWHGIFERAAVCLEKDELVNHLLGSAMHQKKSADEFEATIDADGKIGVPSAIAEGLRGQKVRVRLRRLEISTALAKRDVTEEEIDRIASVQLESRNQVVDFLLTEGALSRNRSFKTRAKTRRSMPGKVEH